MRIALSLLLCTGLAACGAPQSSGVGFDGASASNSAASTVQPVNRRALSQAAEMSFGQGLRRDDRTVSVAGTAMNMRLVTSRGAQFAIFQQKGIPFGPASDMSTQVLQAASKATGCSTTGNVWRKTYSNGAHPKYAVHVTC